MSFVAGIIIAAFTLYLFVLTAVVFVKPALAERFFMGFASSARTHYVEQALRLIIGVALVVRSPDMWQARLFLVIGWILAISAVGLLVFPWQWHHRFGERVLPVFVRHMRFYAVGMAACGALLLYGLVMPAI